MGGVAAAGGGGSGGGVVTIRTHTHTRARARSLQDFDDLFVRQAERTPQEEKRERRSRRDRCNVELSYVMTRSRGAGVLVATDGTHAIMG